MAAPASSINALTNSVGFNVRTVRVTQVDQTQGIALAVDEQNVQVTLPIYLARAKGRIPAAGEVWLIDQILGFWSFAAYVGTNADAFQVVSGKPGGRRIELDPDGLRYYNAAGDLIVKFDTTADSVLIDATKPGVELKTNFASGRSTVVVTANNVRTTLAVTGFNISGSTFDAFTSIQTTAPEVRFCTPSFVTGTGFTLNVLQSSGTVPANISVAWQVWGR